MNEKEKLAAKTNKSSFVLSKIIIVLLSHVSIIRYPRYLHYVCMYI